MTRAQRHRRCWIEPDPRLLAGPPQRHDQRKRWSSSRSGLGRRPHNGGSPHPLTIWRVRYGPVMTPDYRPSLVRSFERHLRAENRSEHTIASYLESIRQAEAFLAGRGRSLVDARRRR